MPMLSWINDTQARQEASKVPFHLLEKIKSYGDPNSDNVLVQGDNLLALKALLPFYKNKVKCIFIDPPYNTGSAFEHYDDNLEHSQWLSMMYPRLTLLKEFLCETGTLWIVLDDKEVHYAKVILDEIFGRQNFVSSVIWRSRDNSSNDEKKISSDHNEILVYSKSKNWESNKLNDLEKRSHFSNPDNDPKGPYFDGNPLNSPNFRENLVYDLITPNGNIIHPPKNGWRWSKETIQEKIDKNEIRFNADQTKIYRRTYLSDMKGLPPSSLWINAEKTGHNRRAKSEQKTLCGSLVEVFETPKPEALVKEVLLVSTQPGDLVLDSFLGSGTTAAVAHKMGRHYIGIEIGEHARTHCIPRLQKVMEGERGGISESVHWQGGGGLTFYKLGEKVFDEMGSINPKVDFKTLAAYIWQKETNTPTECKFSPFLGEYQNKSIFLLYNGILGDKRPRAGNVLNRAVLRKLLQNYPTDSEKIVYGDACFGISNEELRINKITFKQIPYELGR